jgi:ATP-dependent DNA ligase
MSIFSEYNEFKYIYPPRPETTIAPDQLSEINEDWIAQPKYNGSCAVLFIEGQKGYRLFNREGEELSLQKPLNYTGLNDSEKYMVLCGEYLNKNKKGEDGNSFNHKFIIWDILVWGGKYLVGLTFEARLEIMVNLFSYNSLVVTPDGCLYESSLSHGYEYLNPTRIEGIFLAPSYVNHFKTLYDDLIKTDIYEGLVLKRKSAKLETGFKEKNNASWQVKVRKATKSYTF